MTIPVVIADGRTHSRLLAAIFVEGGARGYRNVGERSIVIVVVKDRGRAVAGDENVGPAVFIEVERRYAKGVMAVRVIDVRFGRNIFEPSVAAIVVKDVLCAGQSARTAHHRD